MRLILNTLLTKKTALLLIWQFSQTLFIIMQSFESKRFFMITTTLFSQPLPNQAWQ